jgi:hypothetical protein
MAGVPQALGAVITVPGELSQESKLGRQKINLKSRKKCYIFIRRFNDMPEEVILEGRA